MNTDNLPITRRDLKNLLIGVAFGLCGIGVGIMVVIRTVESINYSGWKLDTVCSGCFGLFISAILLLPLALELRKHWSTKG